MQGNNELTVKQVSNQTIWYWELIIDTILNKLPSCKQDGVFLSV